MVSFKKLMSDYGLGVIIILLLVAFAVSTLSDYITTKSLGGEEGHIAPQMRPAAYGDDSSQAVGAAEDGPASDFAPVAGDAGAMGETLLSPTPPICFLLMQTTSSPIWHLLLTVETTLLFSLPDIT